MREGSWDFYVENDIEPFMTIYSKVMAALQGKRLRVSLEEDAAYFYEGRCWVDNPKQSNGHTILTINYSFNPYKHKFADIGKVVKIAVNGSATIFSGSVGNYTGEPICPKLGIELSSGDTMSIEFTTSSRRYTTSLAKGTWVDPIIMLIPGETTSIVAKGYGTVSLQAIGGWL
nr:MAG TPA: distal tail protein [Caudoviricetes sp.]